MAARYPSIRLVTASGTTPPVSASSIGAAVSPPAGVRPQDRVTLAADSTTHGGVASGMRRNWSEGPPLAALTPPLATLTDHWLRATPGGSPDLRAVRRHRGRHHRTGHGPRDPAPPPRRDGHRGRQRSRGRPAPDLAQQRRGARRPLLPAGIAQGPALHPRPPAAPGVLRGPRSAVRGMRQAGGGPHRRRGAGPAGDRGPGPGQRRARVALAERRRS